MARSDGLDGTPPSPELRELVHLGMQKSYDGIQIVFTESAGNAGMPAFGRPARMTGPILSPRDVLRHEFRASQVRARFSARGIFAMAESALGAEPHFALANLRRQYRSAVSRTSAGACDAGLCVGGRAGRPCGFGWPKAAGA